MMTATETKPETGDRINALAERINELAARVKELEAKMKRSEMRKSLWGK